MDAAQNHATGAPLPATSRDEDGPFVQARRTEAIAYNALIDDGGRPSHPLSLLEDIVTAPGQYRDIVAFWQDRSDEWQVFSKQLSRWQTFRAHQRASREADRFPSYVDELTSRLRLHGFDLPSSFDKPPSGFSRHLDRQNKLATWVEYLNYEFTRRDEYDKWLETCRPGYDDALSQLIRSGAIQPLESVRTPTSDICRPSSIEVTQRKYERRVAEEAYENAKDLVRANNLLNEPQSRQQTEGEDRRLVDAQNRLEAINRRAYCIADFTRKTHAYRFALDRSERHELLLRWALDQAPLIEKEGEDQEMGKIVDANGKEEDQAAKLTFPRFRQLPPEIRLKIWTKCLPMQPTVHFFDVLNCQRKRHLAHSWSSKEFRVRPTTARDSGYRTVYKLLATCREARLAVESYYGRRLLSLRLSPGMDEAKLRDRSFDFRTFDWIPADDLIVLSFPPIQVPQLPAANAFTIAHGPGHPARHIGFLVPKEMLIMPQFNLSDDVEGEDDAAQIALMPEFIDLLHRPSCLKRWGKSPHRGVKRLYFIVEGWTVDHRATQHMCRIDLRKHPATWSENQVCWRFEAARPAETKMPWKYVSPSPLEDSDPDQGPKRQLWWLGSGDAALGLLGAEDIIERSPAKRVNEFLRVLETECGSLGWGEEFEGVEALGWMEPAAADLLEAAWLDWTSGRAASESETDQDGSTTLGAHLDG